MSETSKSDAPGVVVIGRDEGARLERCLRSLQKCDATVVYVDSGSSDGSLERAREAGVQVVELDMSRPFCAARARNAGFDRLCERRPGISWVQFVDGDCELDEHWLERATSYLEEHEGVAIVCGRLREREPDRSVYNRLCDIEWDGAIGEIDACGGIFMVRAQAFSDAGRFNETIAVGEEPDLCWRLRRSGWSIVRCDRFMAWHDAALTHFSQWWRREVRNGYGHLDVARRFGFAADAPFTPAVRSARIWGIGLPLTVVSVFTLAGLISGPAMGFLAALAILVIWPAQVLRVAVRLRAGKAELGGRSALAYGFYTMLAKWPHLVGHRKQRGNTNMQGGVHYKSDAGNWAQDRARYPARAFWNEPSIWAIAIYRFGRWNDRRKAGLTRWLVERVYWRLFHWMELITGISLAKSTNVGPGLRIWHFGNIFIHTDATLGANCTLRQGVTIGNRVEDGPVPRIEDDVDFGAYAQILGGVHIGRGARIGAASVVLQDVPEGATAVGNPARIIPAKEATPSGERK